MAWGEIFAQNSSNINIFNNVIQVQPEARNNMNIACSNVNYGSNVFYSGDTAVTRCHPLGNENAGPGDVVGGPEADPMFADPSAFDFTLLTGSPGRSKGVEGAWAGVVGNAARVRGIFAHVGVVETTRAPGSGDLQPTIDPTSPPSPENTNAESPPTLPENSGNSSAAPDDNGNTLLIWLIGILLAAGAGVLAIVLFIKKR